jgi:polyisoprenoid-binding protein YceI
MALEKWTFDVVHSTISFTVRHLMVSKVQGFFTKCNGSFEFDAQDPASSKAQVEIDVTSIDTREPQRDAHLRSGDFFEADKHPRITFKSTKIERAKEDNHFKLTGDLTMRGVTHPVTLDVEYAGRATHPQMGERIGFSAHTSLNRKDYGVSFNQVLDSGGVALSDKVDVNIEIEATKAA